ncbi:acyltransferase family protein [Mongoliimonas terrestris]|uniref:acyltransferase family protein n=1 Tax=Mongoliimonas terrestris TaxID=1709001 RepID=UPI0009499A3A|nr:acyltransferase [Mongoliimonas terrestris]
MTQATGDHSTARYQFLDLLRAIACLGVILQHSLSGAGFIAPTKDGFGQTVFSFGQTGVLIFFFVSGYIIPKSLDGDTASKLKTFWIKRAFRIYPLYFFVFLLTLTLDSVLFQKPTASLPYLVPHLIFVQSWIGYPDYVGGSWTLFIELVWYISIFLLYFIGLQRFDKFVFYFPLISILSLVAISIALDVRLPFGRLTYFLACFMGLLWLRFHTSQITGRFFGVTFGSYLAVIAAALYAGVGIHGQSHDLNPTFQCVINNWAVGVALTAWIMGRRNNQFRFVSLLFPIGIISYSVYLVHAPILDVLKYFNVSGFAFVILAFVVTLPLASITYRLIEKPAMSFGRSLEVRAPKAIAS